MMSLEVVAFAILLVFASLFSLRVVTQHHEGVTAPTSALLLIALTVVFFVFLALPYVHSY